MSPTWTGVKSAWLKMLYGHTGPTSWQIEVDSMGEHVGILNCMIIPLCQSSLYLPPDPHHSGVFFIKVEPSSQEFKDVETSFQKKWSSKEKACPSLTLVLAIFNPFQDAKFTDYKQVFVKEKRDIVKTFFFGTILGCDLHTYQNPCKNTFNFTECGVCNLASEGFSRLVSPMIPLDRNPADAHHKADPHSASFTFALLMCDVACGGNNKKMKRRISDVEGRPDGVDSVSIRSSSFLSHTDAIRIYNADTVCPRYVLIYV